jgi:signal transduction histidine kinase
MGHALGLVATVAICGWIALDVLASMGRRGNILSVAALALACGLWATGDLLFPGAHTAAERIWLHRIGYLGICALPLAWLAVAAQVARPAWWRKARLVLTAAALPLAVAYSALYWDHHGWFVDFSVVPYRRGSLFWIHTGYTWVLILAGWLYFAQAALRMRRASRWRMAALALGTLTPLAGNAAYLALGVLGRQMADPTPLLLGFGALLIRMAIVDSGLALYLPLARSDVVEQVEVGILVADLEGRVVDANRAAIRLAGSGPLVGRCLETVLQGVRDRTDLSVETRTVPLRSSVAEVGTAALLSDRTEAQYAEQRLALAARLEALGFLTAGIAHEVNNPLAFIRANLSQLEKLAHELAGARTLHTLPLSAQGLVIEAADLVSDTQEGVERIGQLVSRLRSFARNEVENEPRPDLVDLARVAEAAASMAEVGLAPGTIRRRVAPAPKVRALEGELVQVALNLLVNALQASGEMPEIEIEVGAATGGAVLHVLDRGPGLAPEVMRRLFHPFFTTKPAGVGTGLGLSLSYDLARRNGGRLEAGNRPGGGAHFTLWLPSA